MVGETRLSEQRSIDLPDEIHDREAVFKVAARLGMRHWSERGLP
jgi:hypothetical protein